MTTSRTSSRRARQRPRGFTMVEATVSLVLVSAVLVAALGAVAVSVRMRRSLDEGVAATALARDLLAEIMSNGYADEAPLPDHLGTEAGEVPADRTTFDDVDDYDGWISSPPQVREGAPLQNKEGWSRSVDVRWAPADDLDTTAAADTGTKRIHVRVGRGGRTVAELVAVRTLAWGHDPDPPAPVVLLVVADAASVTAQEQARADLIATWAYDVVTIGAVQPQGDFDAAVGTSAVAYVVEQGQSTVLDTKLRDAPIGVVSEEVELGQAFGFSGNSDAPAPTDAIDVIDTTHYVTSPFPGGELVICTAPAELVTLAGVLAWDLVVLAKSPVAGNDQPGLAMIESGGALYGGGNAVARRVQLPWGGVGFDLNALNPDGRTIMRRALDWAAGREQP